jgi:hypothetical protein
LNLVAEGADLPFVLEQHAQQELLGDRPQQFEIGRHARAEVEHHHNGERLRLVLEKGNRLWLAVVENRELVLL